MSDFRMNLLDRTKSGLVISGYEKMLPGRKLPSVVLCAFASKTKGQYTTLGRFRVELPSSWVFDRNELKLVCFKTSNPAPAKALELLEDGVNSGAFYRQGSVDFQRTIGENVINVEPLDPFFLQYIARLHDLIPAYSAANYEGLKGEGRDMLARMHECLYALLALSNEQLARIGIPYYHPSSR